MSKAYPCGAGLGLLGVSTDGDVALCHRFAGIDAHKLGTVRDGIDREAQQRISRATSHRRQDRLLARAGRGRSAPAAAITRRTCATARRRRPNLHYCEWIRGWTDTCLQVYGELSVRNPEFLARFDREEAKAEAVLCEALCH